MTSNNQPDRNSSEQNNGTRQATSLSSLEMEAVKVLADPQFIASPTLTRLLRWLIDETLAGRGDNVKSYAIAVDGLGRREDFDSKTDSYPRVQIGRLKRALESHYAQTRPIDGFCIYLEQGSYRVQLGTIGSAYPQLHHPPTSSQESEETDLLFGSAPRRSACLGLWNSVFLATLATLLVFFAVLAAILLASEIEPLTIETVKHSLPGHQVSSLCPQPQRTVVDSTNLGLLHTVQTCG